MTGAAPRPRMPKRPASYYREWRASKKDPTKPEPWITCRHCGKPVKAKRPWQGYCSLAHRQAAYRLRKAQREEN